MQISKVKSFRTLYNQISTCPQNSNQVDIGALIDISPTDLPGATREYIMRTLAINAFPNSIRDSYCNISIPLEFPDTLNASDRTLTKLFLDHRPGQVKALLEERTHNKSWLPTKS